MKQNKLNIILFGANYFGRMAASQRVKNLFESFLSQQNISIHNLVICDKDGLSEISNSNIDFKNLFYNYKNPISILYFFFLSTIYLFKLKKRGSRNIFYCYGYPTIENIYILGIAFILGFRIVFDIVEDQGLIESSIQQTRRMRLKRYSMVKFEKTIPFLAKSCFAISPYLVERCIKICKGKIPVTLLPISANIRKIQSFRNHATKATSTIKIFYGGSYGIKDGIDTLLKGFEIAHTQVSNIELILTGRTKEADGRKLNQKIATSSASQSIHYLGCLTTNDYFNAMVNADILCVLRVNTQYANAGFPFKLGEYLASGNAVIASKVGGIQKLLTNGENVLLIEPDNALELSKVIISLVEDSLLRAKLGKGGEQVFQNYFNSERVSEDFLKHLSL